MSERIQQKVGDLNGFWVSLFKVALMGMAPLIAFTFSWLGWVSNGMLENRRALDVRIEASKSYVTGKEAVEMKSQFDQNINILRLDMAKAIEDRFDRIEQRLSGIELLLRKTK